MWFINGQPIDSVRELIGSVAARPRHGDPVRYGLAAFVVARPTAAEAQAELDRHWELNRLDEEYTASIIAGADEKAVMFQTFAKYPAIGTNGGTAAGLVGSYDEWPTGSSSFTTPASRPSCCSSNRSKRRWSALPAKSVRGSGSVSGAPNSKSVRRDPALAGGSQRVANLVISANATLGKTLHLH